MKKLACLLFACALSCAIPLTACSNNADSGNATSDNASTTQAATESSAGEVTQAEIEKNLVGKWITTERDGQPTNTDNDIIYEFISTTKARVTVTYKGAPDEIGWQESTDADVTIDGNKVTVTSLLTDTMTAVSELTITSITPDAFTTDWVFTLTNNGTEINGSKGSITFNKIDVDYSKNIIGTWEGKDPWAGQPFRIEFKEDGTWAYYEKNGENWEVSTDTDCQYLLNANLLMTRWKEDGKTAHEYYEIVINGDRMTSIYRPIDDSGNVITETYNLVRVQ